MSLCLTTTVHDERWQRLNLFPITALLLLLAMTNTVLSICVVSVAATESIPFLILVVSMITLIHTFIDLLLIQRYHLDPIYVLILSTILLLFWIGLFVLATFEAIACGWWAPGDTAFTCSLLQARYAMCGLGIMLYTTSVTLAAIALKRAQRLSRERTVGLASSPSDPKLGLIV